MGHFLQIMIARNSLQFLKKKYTISRDHELQKWDTFCKSLSQEKLYNFSRKTTQFLAMANCRNGPLSANYDRKKTIQLFLIMNCRNGPLSANYDCKKNSTISRDHELQKWATFCKSRSQEILYNFSRKTMQFLVITNCRNGPLSANHYRQKNFTISQEKLYNFP